MENEQNKRELERTLKQSEELKQKLAEEKEKLELANYRLKNQVEDLNETMR